MKSTIKELAKLFKAMVKNYNTFGAMWKNIPLGKQAFALMQSLPPTVEGEFDTPADKAALLGQMLDQMVETSTPRFCMEVRAYMQTLDPDNGDNNRKLQQLRDFTDFSLPMEEYCRKYGCHLKFDPVERTPEWENTVYDVERECSLRLRWVPRRMGFCFEYWSVKADVLRRRGIDWMCPAQMNPGVMFD